MSTTALEVSVSTTALEVSPMEVSISIIMLKQAQQAGTVPSVCPDLREVRLHLWKKVQRPTSNLRQIPTLVPEVAALPEAALASL